MASVSDPAFWEELYARGGDGWELGRAAPPLVDVMDTTPPPRGRVIIPGCGRGHDVRFLASRGYDAVGVDFADAAVSEARALAAREGVAATFEQRDVFALPREWREAFDGAWEYTCYCAIDPARRDEYVRALADVIRPGGWLFACFFPLRTSGAGPPFPVSAAELRRRLPPGFRIERAGAPRRSARGRQGREWLVLARRTSDAA